MLYLPYTYTYTNTYTNVCTDNIICVSKAISQTRTQGTIIKDPKTAAGYREIRLPPICFELLSEWKAEERKKATDMGTAWNGVDLFHFDENRLFIQLSGKPMSPETPYQRFKDILRCYNNSCDRRIAEADNVEEKKRIEAEKLPDITMHDLRHTQASIKKHADQQVIDVLFRYAVSPC